MYLNALSSRFFGNSSLNKGRLISNFFYSQYFYEGLRITIGTVIPVLVCAMLGEFLTGTLISLGALVIGISDTPGAPRHRRIGMFYCTLLCALTITLTALANSSIVLMTFTILLVSFFASMLAVFNARAATVGTMCILTMLINVDDVYSFQEELVYLLYFVIGAVWYIIVSSSLLKVRPYRLAQQELSETIIHVADYIRLKAGFYATKEDLSASYIKLIEKQISINDNQENVRDILFQSKRSIKDTTKEGRYLTLIFNDILDLFEQGTTTHYDYESIRARYGESGVLDKIKSALLKVSHELDNIGYKINANRTPTPIYNFDEEITILRDCIDKYDEENGTNSILIKKIIINIRDITKHLKNIFSYAQFKDLDIQKTEIEQSKKFIKTDVLNWQNFKDNLSLDSTACRHAIRMSIMLAGTYLVFNLFIATDQNLYWILLTILVILKPGFGLTKERNLQRLLGTVIGGVIGGIILLIVHDQTILFAILVLFFLIAYSLFRVNYIIAVLFMTPYVLILLSFTGHNTLELAQERILDTFIGGSLAFLSSYIIFPNWESHQIRSKMHELLIANYHYLAQGLSLVCNKDIDIIEYKLARKEVYISSANMGSTFQRLLTEPKWRQTVTNEVNRFVILNHIFSSYSATLITQLNSLDTVNFDKRHLNLLYKSLQILESLIEATKDKDANKEFVKAPKVEIDATEAGSEEAKLVLDQLELLFKITNDIQKTTEDLISKTAN